MVDGLWARGQLKAWLLREVEKDQRGKFRLSLESFGIPGNLHVNRWFHPYGFATLQIFGAAELGLSGVIRVIERVFEALADLEISAIHLAVDLPDYGLDYFRRSITVKGKRLHADVEGTLYFGSRKTGHQIVIYDKRAEQAAKGRASKAAEVRTRIEARYRGKRCPIHSLSELENLIEFNPFDRVILAETNGPNLSNRKGAAFLRATGAHCCLEHQGMSRAELKKRLGSNGKRCLNSALPGEAMTEAPDLAEAFRESIADWLSR